MHAISSYCGNRPTNTQTHKHTNPQTGPITIHCAAKLSVQCNYFSRTLTLPGVGGGASCCLSVIN